MTILSLSNNLSVALLQIVFEDDEISKHPKTTSEIRECCRDIKVLGRKDLRVVLSWWKAVRDDLIGKIKEEKVEPDSNGVKQDSDDDKLSFIDEDELEMKEVDKKIEALTVSSFFINDSFVFGSILMSC